eukprot:gene16831-biopygen13171
MRCLRGAGCPGMRCLRGAGCPGMRSPRGAGCPGMRSLRSARAGPAFRRALRVTESRGRRLTHGSCREVAGPVCHVGSLWDLNAGARARVWGKIAKCKMPFRLTRASWGDPLETAP